MPKRDQISILLLDDNVDLAQYYKQQIEQYAGFRVTIESDSRRARSLAERQLFDIVVIDAKLEYRGFEFGGLRLAEDLRYRYGANSLIVISRFITAALAQIRGIDYEFMEKHSGNAGRSFERELCSKLREMRQQQYVFVAMPFENTFLSIYKCIKRSITNAGFKCVRVDEVSHTRPIQQIVFELVEKSKMVVFLADNGNPNAYYEAGFADAMRKEVIIVAKSVDELKFDIRDRQIISYRDKLATLENELKQKIFSLRHSKPLVV